MQGDFKRLKLTSCPCQQRKVSANFPDLSSFWDVDGCTGGQLKVLENKDMASAARPLAGSSVAV